MKNELTNETKSEQNARTIEKATRSGVQTMKKNSKAAAAVATVAAPVQMVKETPVSSYATAPRLAPPDYYSRTLATGTRGAEKLAECCRRKDEALRIVDRAWASGRDMGAAIGHAFSVAFPTKAPATTETAKA